MIDLEQEEAHLAITPSFLRALSLGEPGVGVPHAGISEKAVGEPAPLP
jgi:hypothetical protein